VSWKSGQENGSDHEDIKGYIKEKHNKNKFFSDSRTFTKNISIRDLLSNWSEMQFFVSWNLFRVSQTENEGFQFYSFFNSYFDLSYLLTIKCRGLMLQARTHIYTHHTHARAVGLLWMRDRLVAETSILQYTPLQETDIHATVGIPIRNSRQRTGQITPYTAQQFALAVLFRNK